ncbi:hypothetical protein [Massilia sp. WF1]|nr:hypothetical protein [Massilia sp. WF1]
MPPTGGYDPGSPCKRARAQQAVKPSRMPWQFPAHAPARQHHRA